MLTPVADGVAVHRSELLQNQTVVVQGRSGVLVVDPGITTAELACLAGDLRAAGRTDSAPHLRRARGSARRASPPHAHGR